MLSNSKFAGFTIASDSDPTYSSKGGTFVQVPIKYYIRFKHPEYHSIVTITDYGSKKKNRNDKLQVFYEHYKPMFEKKCISIICMIVYADEINNISEFIKYFKKRKLKKMGIKAISHVRINDIGIKSRRPHCHVFIVTERFEDSKYDEIFKKSKDNKYKGIPMNETFGLIQYCQKKELYVNGKGKSWSATSLIKERKRLIKEKVLADRIFNTH